MLPQLENPRSEGRSSLGLLHSPPNLPLPSWPWAPKALPTHLRLSKAGNTCKSDFHHFPSCLEGKRLKKKINVSNIATGFAPAGVCLLIAFLTLAGKAQQKNVQAKNETFCLFWQFFKIMEGLLGLAFPLCLLSVLVLFPKK